MDPDIETDLESGNTINKDKVQQRCLATKDNISSDENNER
jgi:hypothetical protein